MSDYSWADIQRQESGEDSPPETVSYTADEVAEYRWENPDDPDCEVLNMVMERSMQDRVRWLERDNARLRSMLEDYDDEDC